MRFLFTTLPGYGHFHPTAPLAAELQVAGHEVLYASARSFCPVIERAGFEAAACGMDWTVTEAQSTFPQLAGLGPGEQFDAWYEIFTGEPPRAMFTQLLELAERWRPDVIVWEFYEQSAPLVAEALGVPHALVGNVLFVPAEVVAEYFGDRIDELRGEVGLPADPGMESLYRHLYLDFLPPSFHIWDIAELATARSIRLPEFDRHVVDALPDWMNESSGRPLVYATLGTTFNRNTPLLGLLCEALADEPFDVVLTTGLDRDPSRLRTAANVHVEEYVPHSLLYPRLSLAITHGAFVTLLAGINHGVPQLVLPQMSDQAIDAQRCEALGIGLALLPDEVTAATVRDATSHLLEKEEFRSRAQSLRREAEGLSPIAEGARHVVELGLTRGAWAPTGTGVPRGGVRRGRSPAPRRSRLRRLLASRRPRRDRARRRRDEHAGPPTVEAIRNRVELTAAIAGKSDADILADLLALGIGDVLERAFDGIVARLDPERSGGRSAVVTLCIRHPDGVSDFTLKIQPDRAEWSKGLAESPHLTLQVDVATFIRLLAGGRKAGLRAFLTGKLRPAGDMRLAAVLDSWFSDVDPDEAR